MRSIEHGNLLDESTIALFREHDAFYVPTLITYRALADEGARHGLPTASVRKVTEVLDHGLSALDMAARGGVQIVFGSDLLGGMSSRQSEEFLLRAEVQSPLDIIRSATVAAARLVAPGRNLGVLAPDAEADLLIVDGDPLEDIGVLARPERHLVMVMKAGRIEFRPA